MWSLGILMRGSNHLDSWHEPSSHRDAGACLVLSDVECHKQFREIKLQFGLLDQINTRSLRCEHCNSEAFSPVDVTFARKEMSERLRKKSPPVSSSSGNATADRIYWAGPKYTRTLKRDIESCLPACPEETSH
ncbi:Hypothetical protein PHPALM_4239 [Phytophthora palmivora]|uniref:Mut7-C RNAse domain-containing protein n=1 Tax=Phytophthora palmivora TaxID=4796 RepID=A0A2P4YKB7_9STRA|nr:Hypothetical protein PHPALM_4239 [Phytophthora palmivora]